MVVYVYLKGINSAYCSEGSMENSWYRLQRQVGQTRLKEGQPDTNVINRNSGRVYYACFYIGLYIVGYLGRETERETES